MMNNLQIFKSEDFGQIRTVEIGRKLYFVATDIAKSLGYKDTTNAIKQHCKWVVKHHIPHPQSKTKTLEVNIIPEGDMYRLVSNSELQNAEKFESWIFDDVLPTIRQTGAYITNNANPEKLREKASEIEKLQLAYNSTSMLKELLDGAGFDNKSKLLTAKTLYKKAGIDLPIEIDEEEHYFDTKQIASKLKIYSKSNKPAQMAICEIIKKIDLEENEVKGVWETNGSWTGTVNKYTKSVIDKISKWIEKNNRPTKIAGEKKNYHVVYKIE
ncbi:TPA: toxin Bro [Clostridioides difficile]|nr:toxin Bro [Clostridioides difficile]HBF6292574.1 toxin Bro [Clostridioides difficile]HBY2691767.1 toxin Bro [Clostridioides difficile]